MLTYRWALFYVQLFKSAILKKQTTTCFKTTANGQVTLERNWFQWRAQRTQIHGNFCFNTSLSFTKARLNFEFLIKMREKYKAKCEK